MATTVAQLIAELQQYPADWTVQCYDVGAGDGELLVRHPLDAGLDEAVLDGDLITPKEQRR